MRERTGGRGTLVDLILDLPSWLVAILIIGGFGVVGVGFVFLLRPLVKRHHADEHNSVFSDGFAAVATVYAIIAGLLCVLATNPLRRTLDADRDRTASVHPRVLFSRRNLATPFRALARSPALLPLTALAFSFAVLQGALFSFSVTFLTQRGLSLAAAGFAFACLQAAGTVARILLGWVADRA